MLRLFSVVLSVAAALLGMSALPASATSEAAASGSFTVPSVSSSVQAYGSYETISAARVKVTLCTKVLNSAVEAGAEATAYNASYSQHAAISAVVLADTPSRVNCATGDLKYTAHLTLYSFLVSGGTQIKKSPVKTVY